MNKTVVGILVGALLGAGATWLVVRPHAVPVATVAKAEPAAAKAPEKENPLHFPAKKRNAAGITLKTPTETTLAPEVAVFGRVLDPTPLITLVAELATARAAQLASEKEADRSRKLLVVGGNASAQAVELAEANAARDHAAVASAQARLAAAWGRDIAGSLGAISQALESGAALVRLDVLPGESVGPAPKVAHLTWPGSAAAVEAEIIGVAPTADPQMQGPGFLGLARERALPAGAAIRGTLPGVGEATSVLVVPRSAIVYHQGSAWAFVLGEEDTFERKLVTLGRSVGNDDVIITQGLAAGEQVVVTGPQQILAAELQAGGAPEGD